MNSDSNDTPRSRKDADDRDYSKCRAKCSGFANFFDCLTVDSSTCPYAISFGYGVFCRHPEAQVIAARSENIEWS
jgi:hypothetical protein